jgi:hypothetical protein
MLGGGSCPLSGLKQGGSAVEDSSNFAILDKWEYSGELTLEEAEAIRAEFDALADDQLSEVDEYVEKDPYTALGLFTRFTSFVNAAISRLPNVIRALERWVQRIQKRVRALARKLGADSYEIGVSMPTGVSFALSFPT